MIELDVDMVYLDDDDLKHVVLHDECGEHESVEYVRRDEYDEMREATARRKDRCLELLDENARLRELVKALLTCATDGYCDECRLNGATPWHIGKVRLCDGVWEHMRELGIEVS